MSDITMCLGEGCAMRDECRRYTSKPDPLHQSYMRAPVIRFNSGLVQCDYFSPTRAWANDWRPHEPCKESP